MSHKLTLDQIMELCAKHGLMTKIVRNGFMNDYVKALEGFANDVAELVTKAELVPTSMNKQSNVDVTMVISPENPYKSGSPRENWQRGYDGIRCFGAKGSDAYKHWHEGVIARKAITKG